MIPWTLSAVRLFVTDIEKAKQFYCDQLEMPLKQDGRSDGFLLFDLGTISVVVEAIANPNQEADLVGRFVGITFNVPDVQSLYDSLRAKGIEFMGTPQLQPWGGTTVSILDPDKNAISFVSVPK
ncbi:MAG: VOC family protein [Oculatellaceae cyanobacterium Prado106]|jgi:extradiol dioxygenase family protein|nr:VOC family protein [Oculatellaceae cyanobacterium Prado106]